MENGNTKDDLRLPTDETLLAQVCQGDLCFYYFPLFFEHLMNFKIKLMPQFLNKSFFPCIGTPQKSQEIFFMAS